MLTEADQIVFADRHRLGRTRWWTGREFALRSAGFPTRTIERLTDTGLAAAADRCPPSADTAAQEHFAAAFAEAVPRLSAAARDLAGDPRFREAVTWQNPAVLANCLDKLAQAHPTKPDTRRRRELVVAKYAQRYALKNDTIGFFGPVGWGHWTTRTAGALLRPGPDLLAQRTLYFEFWAVDAVAEALSRDPGMLPWLRPQRSEEIFLDGDRVLRPRGSTVDLDATEVTVLRDCDGTRSVAAVAERLAGSVGGPDEVVRIITELAGRDLLRLDLVGPLESRPERTLRGRLDQVADPAVRAGVSARFDRVLAARDRVAAAAGDAERLGHALGELRSVFEEVTGASTSRRAGEMYAGRTLVYEDTVRDVDLRLGTDLLDQLAGPLGLLLEAAEWLVARAAEHYEARLSDLYDRCRQRLGRDEVPLATLVAAASPDLAFSFDALSPPAAALRAEFQQRWAGILAIPADVRRHTLRADAIAPAVRRLFPGGAPRWSAGMHHSPDLMIAAPDAAAIGRGEHLFVLGELHVAMNTLDARFFVEQHPRPARLRDLDAADHGHRRVFPVPAKESGQVNSRTYPSALMSPDYTYWTAHRETVGAPSTVVPAAACTVRRDGTRLVVRFADRDTDIDLLEVLGEYLSAAITNCFAPVAPAAHRPRVTIDRLVVARESWTLPVADIRWALVRNEPERYRLARSWRRENGLPERAFYRVPGEDKPMFIDFTSIAYVNLLASAVRTCAENDALVSFTELLPDLDQLWLRDRDGDRYTCELRLVCTDPRHGAGYRGETTPIPPPTTVVLSPGEGVP